MFILKRSLVGALTAVVLSSCGGGGDVAGDTSDFGLSPAEVKLTVPSVVKGDCSSSAFSAPTTITIIGGQPPFRIVNSSPDALLVDKTEASGKDPKFTVQPRGACGDPFIVTVLDYHSQAVTLEYTVDNEQPEEEETPTPAL